MTDSTAAPIPAGWYPDGSTPGALRWWDGTAWSEHTSAAAGYVAPRPQLPADRVIYSPFIWLLVLIPLLSYASFFLWQPDFTAIAASPTSSRYNPLAIYTPGYFAIAGGSWLLYGVSVVLAWRDRKWLEVQGVVRPFHWAWTFLGGIVYVIGRSVIVRRVARPRGLAPVWLTIGVYIAGFILIGIWMAVLFSSIAAQFPTTG